MNAMKASAGLRYEGALARHGHVESWFLKANDPRSRRALWLKWTVWAGDRAPAAAIAEVWAVAFGAARGQVAVKTAVPFDGGLAHFDARGLDVTVDGCSLTATSAKGRVESGGRVIAYDLTIDPRGGPLLHYPSAWMYSGPWPAQKLASPIPSARVSGTFEVQGETWAVDGWPGMVGHNWGSRHSPRYAWAHCNAWEGADDFLFEGVSGGAGPHGLGGTVLCFRLDGVRHDLNGLRSLAHNTGAITPRRWTFRGRARDVAIDGEMWAESDDFVGLFYENPSDPPTHCLNSKLAQARLEIEVRGRAPFVAMSRAAALEIGTTDPTHGVRMYV